MGQLLPKDIRGNKAAEEGRRLGDELRLLIKREQKEKEGAERRIQPAVLQANTC